MSNFNEDPKINISSSVRPLESPLLEFAGLSIKEIFHIRIMPKGLIQGNTANNHTYIHAELSEAAKRAQISLSVLESGPFSLVIQLTDVSKRFSEVFKFEIPYNLVPALTYENPNGPFDDMYDQESHYKVVRLIDHEEMDTTNPTNQYTKIAGLEYTVERSIVLSSANIEINLREGKVYYTKNGKLITVNLFHKDNVDKAPFMHALSELIDEMRGDSILKVNFLSLINSGIIPCKIFTSHLHMTTLPQGIHVTQAPFIKNLPSSTSIDTIFKRAHSKLGNDRILMALYALNIIFKDIYSDLILSQEDSTQGMILFPDLITFKKGSNPKYAGYDGLVPHTGNLLFRINEESQLELVMIDPFHPDTTGDMVNQQLDLISNNES